MLVRVRSMQFLDIKERGGEAVPVYCDHSNSEDVKKLFEKIAADTDGQLDILVNNAYSGVPVRLYAVTAKLILAFRQIP